MAGTTIGGDLLEGWLQRIQILRLGCQCCCGIGLEFFDMLDEVVFVFPDFGEASVSP